MAYNDDGYMWDQEHTTYFPVAYQDPDSGFNEPEFEEYDPTPYGGGYDIVSVYGKPLTPSDQTCYPQLKGVGKREMGKDSYSGYEYDYPWPEYDNTNAAGVGYDYGYGKQVVQVPPYEYSPEVVDLCESIFGSWPCLARIRKQQMGQDNKPGTSGHENRHHSPWEDCAGYIFGHPVASNNV
ncbi:hypothetical protein E3N88_33442 [Mikania micrantha]|uniref:Uncharacterized protein n=1 Tax=Mikania micrantha TaxID=192012 RepID=A0A5N6MCN1_9ASTR|nr:hypothetical protein E3N88_33442 [Mikania micrantha]